MLERILNLKRDVEENLKKLDQLINELSEMKSKLINELDNVLTDLQITGIDKEELKNFIEEPYCVIPRKKDVYWIIVPKFVKFGVGWLEHETKSYRIFAINRYIQWLTPVPQPIKEKIKFKERPSFKIEDGHLITGEYQDYAWRKYREFLSRREGNDRIKIKRGYEFRLIAKLIEDGILPFIPHPVKHEHLRDFDRIKLRDYQERAWRRFLETGAIGVFWPFGAGKSFFALYVLARIKGPKLVVVPTRTLVEQWKNRVRKWIPEHTDEIEIITYRSADKVMKKKYTLVVFDEVHHLLANTFIKLSAINRNYTIGLSGSPFREDGRENLIFALTGFPVGLSWDDLIRQKVVAKPQFKVYITRTLSLIHI